ncbi:MAG: hypothetical protein CMN02_11680 [Roseibacillus sp.]|nr:hypothetical protein [Roseibacillus sp.]|tara:strand:- start:818 stop:1378 length:561 start_codon:yes stop_codon:yes gene_type:complete
MKTLLKLAILFLILIPASLHAQIEAGGAIKIAIQGVPTGEQARINGSYPVSETGFITMWKIGSIKVLGSETDVLARKIEAAYRDAEIYTSPVIQILADSGDNITVQMVTVGGKVRAPGAKPYRRGMTLYQAVMAAGGPTEFGAVNRISLFRNGKRYIYDLNKGEHKLLKLYPKDTVDIPQKTVFGN